MSREHDLATARTALERIRGCNIARRQCEAEGRTDAAVSIAALINDILDDLTLDQVRIVVVNATTPELAAEVLACPRCGTRPAPEDLDVDRLYEGLPELTFEQHADIALDVALDRRIEATDG